ncbi:hypothetical protein sscle_03g031820 [Sclerotinia sclerotiorum 1980 UF-70]|uniref:Rhodopsin domain-containing protein n=1 Tax=Sclerotinia sclerotiorum (strain ATCC 18683 / 1980 / Ss-1) TaxID=665079 RepID=A0A1D9Q0S8_SCLS1|nr:hypothetical protein sscle_03g031820 [Sclerotinia sclerotiorum 1980 UF-70]
MSPSQAGVYTVSAILICASAFAVALRFRARLLKHVSFESDDYLAAFSMLFVWALAIVLIIGAARGSLGTHTKLNPQTGGVIPTWHEIDTSKLAGISQLLIIPALGALKLSVVMLYRRIFVGKTFNTISIIVCIVIVAWTISFFFATVFECGRDLGLLWHSLKTFKMDCGKYKYIQLGHAASDVATDLIVLALPLPVIWNLHMTKERKIGLSLIFLLGLLSTAAGTARLVIVAEDIYETTTGSRDVRGVETNAMVWSYVEVGVGVVAACLPTLRPIFGSRTPESLVNSVRSAVTLNSLTSSRRRAFANESGIDGTASELKDYERLTRERSNHEAASTRTEEP